jgi:hypothetical protein
VGLLPADNDQQVSFAYKLYTDISDEGWRQSNKFKQVFSLNVDIHFIGVWCARIFGIFYFDVLMWR